MLAISKESRSMLATWRLTSQGPPCSSDDVAAWLMSRGLSRSRELEEWFTVVNGASVQNVVVTSDNLPDGKFFNLHVLYGINHPTRYLQIDPIFDHTQHFLPNYVVPIASDDLDDQVCVMLDPDHFGCVMFYDTIMPFNPKTKNLHLIADSLDHFIRLCRAVD